MLNAFVSDRLGGKTEKIQSVFPICAFFHDFTARAETEKNEKNGRTVDFYITIG